MAIIKLKGTRILVTRPTHQASPLMEAIEQAGGIALHFPTIQIECVDNSLATEELLPHLDDYRLAIFTSPNAVDQGLPQMRRDRELPATLRLAAIGTATAQRLQALLGRVIDIVPHGRSNSEGLLTEPALQEVDGQKIVIVRGTGGRELLASTLRARGAQVDYLEVYRRTRPAPGLPWPGRSRRYYCHQQRDLRQSARYGQTCTVGAAIVNAFGYDQPTQCTVCPGDGLQCADNRC